MFRAALSLLTFHTEPAEHPQPFSGFFFSADDSCPKPPEIANGYVEHLVRYRCRQFYRLRTEGDGKAWMSIPPSTTLALFDVPMMNGAGVPGQKLLEYCLEPGEIRSKFLSPVGGPSTKLTCFSFLFCLVKGLQFHGPCCLGV